MPVSGDSPSVDARWYNALTDLVDRSHLCAGEELPDEINAAVRPLGLYLTLYLVDHEQETLRRVPARGRGGGAGPPELIPVEDDSAPARAYRMVSVVPEVAAGRLWVAMVDGTERLGVVAVESGPLAADDPDLARRCTDLIGLVGHLVATKTSYGDGLALVRRSRPMTPAAELLLNLMPPLTFSCRRLVVSAVLEPAYECGGDAFDYAVTGAQGWLVTLDAMGRGMRAGLSGAITIAALRATRRASQGVDAAARAADAALTEQFTDGRFVTGVLADLDLETGRLRYVNAGHPEPLLLRGGKLLRTLADGRQLPLGLGGDRTDIGEDTLEPGDRLLLYTDGVVDVRDESGRPIGLDRFVDMVEDTAFSGLPTPETLRQLTRTVLAGGPPRDDATIMMVEWPPDPTERITP